MKFVKSICLFFVCACSFFYLGAKTSQFFYPGRSSANTKKIAVEENNQLSAGINNQIEKNEVKSIPVVSNEEKITCDTIYVVEEYDGDKKEKKTLEQKLPEQYIGYNREQLMDAIKHYEEAPSLADLEKGFVSCEVQSFSKEKVSVLKTYYSGFLKEQFYLVAQNNYLVVYYLDMKNVYMYTDILIQDLPEDVANEVLDKKYISNEEELYNFLESYSS